MSLALQGAVFLVFGAAALAFSGHMVDERARYFFARSWMAGSELLTFWAVGALAALSGVLLLLWAGGVPWSLLTAANRILTAGLGVGILLGSRRLADAAFTRYPNSSTHLTRATPAVIGIVVLMVAWTLGGVAPL